MQTGIADLFEVKMALQSFNDWQSLGLALGLLYHTLERVQDEQHRVIERCKTKMLVAWLQQEDNVTEKGVPCWATLKRALEQIGERQLANEISTKK